MKADDIRCKACGTVNDVTAFACAGCGTSLVAGGAERWREARERDLALESDASRSRGRSAAGRRVVLGAVVMVALVAVGWQAGSWYLRNYYPLAAPMYDNRPPEYWANMMLTSEDHYLRQRGALALDRICDRFNERTAREIVPSLRRALEDPDEVVRSRAQSALDKIAAATGVTE